MTPQQTELPLEPTVGYLRFRLNPDCSTTLAKCRCGYEGTIDDFCLGEYSAPGEERETCFCPACHEEWEVVWDGT